MRLASYLRTSTNGNGNGDSLAAQEDACRTWAKEHGHEVIAVQSDEGLSGGLGVADRPGLADALAAIEQGDVDGLIVHRLDRLAREMHVQEATLATVWAAGGRVFEAVEGEVPEDDPDDPMRRAMRQMAGVFAELERGMIRARLRSGRKRKRERGGYTGGPTVPFGYRVEGQGAEARLVPDDREQQVVERVMALRAEGLTLKLTAAELNRMDVAPPSGKGRWHPATIRRVLAARKRLGKYGSQSSGM